MCSGLAEFDSLRCELPALLHSGCLALSFTVFFTALGSILSVAWMLYHNFQVRSKLPSRSLMQHLKKVLRCLAGETWSLVAAMCYHRDTSVQSTARALQQDSAQPVRHQRALSSEFPLAVLPQIT